VTVYDAILFAELNNPAAAYHELKELMPEEKILVPAIIGLNAGSD